MASILLHISARQLNDRINALGARMDEFRRIADDYQKLNDDVKTFMEDTDDNFKMMQENVRQNIILVNKSYNIAKINQKQLQDELASLENLQTQVGTTLDTGLNAAKSVVDLIQVSSDLDI